MTGIDIGGSTVKVAHADTTATSDPYTNPAPDTLRAAITQALDRAGAQPARACLCLPGIVEDNIITASINLPNLIGVDVRSLVNAQLRIESDVRAAAHHIWHTTKPPGRLLAIALGTGVGACVLDEGVPLRITANSSGHLGQIDVGDTTLESVLGADALRRAGEPVANDRITLSPTPTHALARAIRTAHAIYRPNHITLLGGIGIRLNLTPLRAAIDTHLTTLARPAWTLTQGHTTYHAALGAALLARDA